jgi:hypothetical protein
VPRTVSGIVATVFYIASRTRVRQARNAFRTASSRLLSSMNVLSTRQPRRACRTQNRTRGEIPYQLGLSGAGLLHWQQKPPHDIVHILVHTAKANSSRLLLNV